MSAQKLVPKVKRERWRCTNYKLRSPPIWQKEVPHSKVVANLSSLIHTEVHPAQDQRLKKAGSWPSEAEDKVNKKNIGYMERPRWTEIKEIVVWQSQQWRLLAYMFQDVMSLYEWLLHTAVHVDPLPWPGVSACNCSWGLASPSGLSVL